jgi:sterol desaturase/sphingolipid hydroxylase (fatty acid hydroxylase superfamily)
MLAFADLLQGDTIQQEGALRVAFFLLIFAVVAAAEIVSPRRPLTVEKPLRWRGNLSIHLVNALLPRLLFPILPVGLALLWARKGWGLLNMIPLPEGPAILASVLALDLVIYAQHWAFHRNHLLWRLHRMHHTDLDIDLTSALRFHPLEILCSLLVKLAFVALLGPPALGVLIFEVLLNGMAMFNHGNIMIPAPVDGRLRQVLVTPDMHRVHHSVIPQERNCNFGFNLSWWDRLFGTYQAQPKAGHDKMTLGIPGFRDVRYAGFWKMLVNPFENRPAA